MPKCSIWERLLAIGRRPSGTLWRPVGGPAAPKVDNRSLRSHTSTIIPKFLSFWEPRCRCLQLRGAHNNSMKYLHKVFGCATTRVPKPRSVRSRLRTVSPYRPSLRKWHWAGHVARSPHPTLKKVLERLNYNWQATLRQDHMARCRLGHEGQAPLGRWEMPL